jgi:hypothetical protein
MVIGEVIDDWLQFPAAMMYADTTGPYRPSP